MSVTICCANGETGTVYQGEIPFEITSTDLGPIIAPMTQIMVNLGNPDQAFHTAMTLSAGVGLAQLESIIIEYIGIHPMALVHPNRVPQREQVRIDERIAQFASGRGYFVRNLA